MKPPIDFYLLPKMEDSAKALFACRLCDKAYQKNQQVYIHTDSLEASKKVDEVLWNFRAESFIPHHIIEMNPGFISPIRIGHNKPEHSMGVLINLTGTILDFFEQYSRVIEIVINTEEAKQKARENFRQYRQKGYSPNFHDLISRNHC